MSKQSKKLSKEFEKARLKKGKWGEGMKTPTITIEIEGNPEDGGKVRLNEFLQQLEAITSALRDSEKRLTGRERSTINYRIIHLSQQSPATVTIEPIDGLATMAQGQRAVGLYDAMESFLDELTLFQEKKRVPQNLDYHAVDIYRDIGNLKGKHISKVTIRNGKKGVEIDQNFQQSIEEAIGPDEKEEGAIAGKLEAINLHGQKNFYIYPTLGPRRIKCLFADDFKNLVKNALEERVEVEGTLYSKSWDRFPYKIVVNRMEVYESDDALPKVADLVGIAPDITDGLGGTAYVRKLRDEEW